MSDAGRGTGDRCRERNLSQQRALPADLERCSRLTVLDASSNQLAALPESIGELPYLAQLDLHNNCLTALPESFPRLSTLRDLSLKMNQLTALLQERFTTVRNITREQIAEFQDEADFKYKKIN